MNVRLAGGGLAETRNPKPEKVILILGTVWANDSSASTCRTIPC